MKKYRLFSAISLMAVLLFSACSQDELGEQGTMLPEGEYPLQIGGVSIAAEASEQPWTRVTESTDGQSSVWDWDGSEQIGVQLDDETSVYTLNAGQTLSSSNPLYWTNTAPATITAWYPTDETVNIGDQTNGLAYVMHASVPNAQYNQSINLDFKHQLAKVRVVLSGTQAFDVTKVEVYNYTQCTHTQGTVSAQDSDKGWIAMRQVDATTYEANVVPGNITFTNFIRINDQIATINNGFPTTLQAATMYSIDLTVGEHVLEDGAELNDAGTYYMAGTYAQGITISGEGITVVLDDATLNTSGIGIDVQSDATIQVSGANNTITSGSAGIYVAEGSTVTITGSDRDGQLTVKGGENAAGIGGYTISSNNTVACGNITISNVTVTSYGSCNWSMGDGDMSPGIGSAGRAACGTITIDNATVHAYGAGDVDVAATPAIGCGIPGTLAPFSESIPKVIIKSNSEVHAHRGGVIGDTDYIGWANTMWDDAINASNTINLGGGTCTNSTVYCYTGDSETPDKTVVYDADGNDTEQSQ